MASPVCRRPGYTKLMKNMANVTKYLRKRIEDLGTQALQRSFCCCWICTSACRACSARQQHSPAERLAQRLVHVFRRPLQGGERGAQPAARGVCADTEGRQGAQLHRVSASGFRPLWYPPPHPPPLLQFSIPGEASTTVVIRRHHEPFMRARCCSCTIPNCLCRFDIADRLRERCDVATSRNPCQSEKSC